MEKYIYKDSGFEYQGDGQLSLCLGLFDGLHKGHIKLISQALKESMEVGVLTFEGELKQMTENREGGILTSISDREEMLKSMGVSSLFVLPFNESVYNMPAEDFINDVLKPLEPEAIYIGKDFRFGKGALGDYKTLLKYFKVVLVEFVTDEDNNKISTKAIISMIRGGDILKANACLGRNYRISGKVIHGLGNGGKVLGYPTANIALSSDYVIPKNGVYATRFIIDGRGYLSMTDIGHHPTIDGLKSLSIETNIFDFVGNIYSDNVKVEFLDYIREEKKFDTIGELMLQLRRDKDYIEKKYHI